MAQFAEHYQTAAAVLSWAPFCYTQKRSSDPTSQVQPRRL